MQLTGKNCQCWSEFSLTLEGLTVIVGPSNKGKSSLFRTLKGVLRNDISDDFIRNNQDDPLEITLQTGDTTVHMVRPKGKSVKYTINHPSFAKPKDYSSLGGKVPEELAKLNFGEVKVGEYTVDPIFSGQNKAQFLIDSDRWKPNELNSILGAFSSTEKLDAGKKEANLRITQRKSEASALATEIRLAESRSANLQTITDEASIVAITVHDLERAIRSDELVVGQLGTSIRHLTRLSPLQSLLETLSIPTLTEAGALVSKKETLHSAIASRTSSVLLREVESQLDEVALVWNDLVVIFKQGKAITELISTNETKKDILDIAVASVTEVHQKVSENLSEAKSLYASIAYLEEVSSATKTQHKLTVSLAELDVQIEEAMTELDEIKQSLVQELAAKERASKLCPDCGETMEHVCR